MQQHIERASLQQQIELFRFRSRGVIRYFDQRVPLHLSLGFEPPVSPRPLAGDLQAFIPGFALRTTGLPGRCICFEQLELAAVVHRAHRQGAA